MICERCRQNEVVARVQSEVIDLAVCAECVTEAEKYVGAEPSDLKIVGLPDEHLAAE